MYLINVYAPNVEQDKSEFYKNLHRVIIQSGITRNDRIVIGGDWNTILSADMDKAGGIKRTGEVVSLEMREILLDLELVDMWRIKNPHTKRFTFRQKRPLIQTRLDYFLVSNCICDNVEQAQILTSYCSDHSCISKKFNSLPKQEKGNGYWKFNASLIEDENYVSRVNQLIDEWVAKYDYLQDKRVKWDLIKYEIRKFTCKYCAQKRKEQIREEKTLHERLEYLETQLGNGPGDSLNNEYHACKVRASELEEIKAKGAIIRSKVKWLEEGEKSTSFFFGVEKYNFNKKHLRKIIVDDGTVITDNDLILRKARNFYKLLYKSNCPTYDDLSNQFFSNNNLPQLCDAERESCDTEITEQECLEMLKSLKGNKSPGNDGLSKEFYLKFWKKLSKPLLESYVYSFENGSLSNSQKQAIITLLEKHGKDRSNLKNWRPISLLNVDYKLLTKVLANRIKKVLPSVISISQTGYVKERSINDSIRLVQDIICYAEVNHMPGVLLAVDFQKAFDSIEWEFIQRSLEKFNFGPVLMQWVKTIYTDIRSCIYNNGKTSQYFNLYRGVRQGDPLSPYLFIMTVEVLACAIKQNKDIKGFKIGMKEIKMTQYADDLTLLLSNLNSVQVTLNILENFGHYSGVKINTEKTEGMFFGPWENNKDIPRNIKWVNGPIKLLGIYISAKANEIVMENFQSKIDALLRQLHWWKARDLSLNGKVLIIKSLALSKFQYLVSLVHIPQNVVKLVNSIIYEFIWNGKTDKVKRNLFEQDYRKGGYKMTNLSDIITSSSIMWVKNYLDNIEREWKNTFESFSKKKNLRLFLASNFDIDEIPTTMPTYYIDALKAWASVATQPVQSLEDIQNQCLWYNRELKVGLQSAYSENLFSSGMWFVGDLFQEGNVIPFDVWLKRGVNESLRMKWYSIVRCVQNRWPVLRNNVELGSQNLSLTCGVLLEGTFVDIKDITQKIIKDILSSRKFNSLMDNDHKYRIAHERFHGFMSNTDWESIFMIPRKSPVDNKTKDMQYKILMRFIPTNYLLYKMKKVNSQNCHFCIVEPETIEHLFFNCVIVKNIWFYVFREWHKVSGKMFTPSLTSCIFGTFERYVNGSNTINTIMLIVKSYIMYCKFERKIPSQQELARIFKYKVSILHMAGKLEGFGQLILMFQE